MNLNLYFRYFSMLCQLQNVISCHQEQLEYPWWSYWEDYIIYYSVGLLKNPKTTALDN